MAKTVTSRMGVTQWSAGTDSPLRTDFNTSFGNIELLSAIDKQDITANRPSAGVRGTFFYDQTTGILYRDTGTAWVVVGSVLRDAVAASSAVGTVPFTAQGQAGQTADVADFKVGSTIVAKIDASGNLTASIVTGTRATLTATDPAQPVLFAKQAASPSTDAMQIQDSTGSNLFKVGNDGTVTGKYSQTGSGFAMVGNTALANVANLSTWSGRPAMDITGTKGGTSSTFNEFLYLHHAAVDTTPVTRRIGALFRIGAEVIGDVDKTGSIYIESSAANAATPSMILSLADVPAITIPNSGDIVTARGVNAGGQVTANPTGTGSYQFGTSGNELGTQGNSLYARIGSGGAWYLYQGGVYSASPADPGSGGSLLASMKQIGSDGVVTANRFVVSNTATLPSSTPPFQIGSQTGANLQAANATVQAVTNAVASTLNLNTAGGTLNLSKSGVTTNVLGLLSVAGTSAFTGAVNTTSDLSIGGILSAQNLRFGSTTITTVANNQTKKTVTYSAMAGTHFYGFAVADSTVPGDIFKGCSVDNVDGNSMDIYVYRTTVTSMTIFWLVLSN